MINLQNKTSDRIYFFVFCLFLLLLFSCQSNTSDFDGEENQSKETKNENDKIIGEEREIISSNSKYNMDERRRVWQETNPWQRKFELQVKTYLEKRKGNKNLIEEITKKFSGLTNLLKQKGFTAVNLGSKKLIVKRVIKDGIKNY